MGRGPWSLMWKQIASENISLPPALDENTFNEHVPDREDVSSKMFRGKINSDY